MMRSMYSAVSGLKTHQTKMDVIGNNIANVNTVAFKSSSVVFQDVLYQMTRNASGANAATGTGGVNAKQIGLGVTTGATNLSITTSGAAETTGRAFDHYPYRKQHIPVLGTHAQSMEFQNDGK